jgi:hypothetical protein
MSLRDAGFGICRVAFHVIQAKESNRKNKRQISGKCDETVDTVESDE